ncbi:Glutamate--tRNA ligase [Choanephora cucurbitarum]|uniref:glutamate--tRNA ligase n=1 Tax=Choanephora cucurbitarum TaxID=101091 RepID=A0A1C7NDU3_9FUNG|nr:Glutamate--tRNA ligase [Choanephora cucurbitarum]
MLFNVRLVAATRRSAVFNVTSKRFLNAPARVRFAPSPTGQLHLGGLRTALFNYLLAKKTGGQFILRIEDTDQSQRTELYREHAHQLIESGHAYRCFCTPERLNKVREQRQKQGNYIAYDKHCSFLSEEEIKERLDQNTPFTVRLRTPYEGSTEHKDLVYGKIQFSNKTIDDTILLKSDGFPTYHLANVVDDHKMKITHVLRGEEWLSSTPKHILLYKAFGWQSPQFAHLPLLLNPDGSKLSKRSGDVHVEQYIAKGYLPEAINNFVVLLGWHPQDNTDALFDMQELIEQFDMSQINHSGAIVDHQKLDWINKQHILKRAETSEGLHSLVDILKPFVDQQYASQLKDTENAYRLEHNYLVQVIDTIKERIRNVSDIPTLCSYYFVQPDFTSADAQTLKKKLKQPAIDLITTNEFTHELSSVTPFDADTIKPWIYSLAESKQLNPNHVMMALRYAVTGSRVGAGVAETIQVLGKDTVLRRLQNYADKKD